MYLSEKDVVRHPLVQKIVKAYEKKTMERERVLRQKRDRNSRERRTQN